MLVHMYKGFQKFAPSVCSFRQTFIRMSSWRGKNSKPGSSSYSQNADRLRAKLSGRNESNDEPNMGNRRPPGLKGREIGLWYAQQHKRNPGSEKRLLLGPNISLPDEKIRKLRATIGGSNSSSGESGSTRFRQEFNRHRTTDFMELLKQNVQPPTKWEVTETDENLYDEFINKGLNEDYIDMIDFRMTLPAHKSKQEIINLIEANQVILIEGNTGCGKTTQVPQYILDEALMNKKGKRTRILCTQPRRIAATSIAERVASERAEPLGKSIGYQIRLEKVLPRSCASVTFCTTGVLLKFMEIDPALNGFSHIIIDEIHERNSHIDLCLALIKQIIQHRKDLKIILMSATLNADSFSKYFNNCPMVHIEGFTYEVEDLFLEDILEETGYDNFKNTRSGKEPVWAKYKNKKKRENEQNDFELAVGHYVRSLRGRYSSKTIDTLSNPETENIDTNFIQHVIEHISYSKGPGAILCILPGYTVISKLNDELTKSPNFPSDKFVVYPLHSMLNGSDQRNIFIRPPAGVRKIILATPLAETSITIDDVVYVINSGKMRKPFFDFERSATVLEDQWITKANETQRKGRAGRVQAGFCYHLYTRGRSNTFEQFEEPEILRIRLEEVLLTIKVLCIKNVKNFIEKFIDAPKDSVVDNSMDLLQRLGAVDDSEDLTPLGLHLARLAVPPQIGKMLLLSSIFSCFDPISSAAAGLSFKTPFYSIMGKEEMCNRTKRKFSNDSDQLAVTNAMKQWKSESNQRGFCYHNFLSHSTMQMLDKMKTQFANSLYQTKFLVEPHCNVEANNQNSRDINVIRAVICGGLYPHVAYRSLKVTRNRRSEIIKTVDKRVKLLPSCVNCDGQSVYEPGFMVYFEQNKFNDQLFLTETTANVGPYAILMFGDRINTHTENETNYITVGNMVQFKCSKATAELIVELRAGFNQLLEKKIEEPSPIVWDSSEGKLLIAIIELIAIGSNSFRDYGEMDHDEYDDE